MRKGMCVAYRLQHPNQYDDGWRPALILSRNNKGYVIGVFLNPVFDRDRPDYGSGYVVIHNVRKDGDDVGCIGDIETIPGLDGEKPYDEPVWPSSKTEAGATPPVVPTPPPSNPASP